MLTWLFVGASLLVAAAGLAARHRLSRLRDGLSDDDIRALERGARIEVDEPLDLDEAADEEARFWNETWDEPEPM